ncbi:30S ribosomal protein S1 [Rhynchospora pubera]|uniref:30S ribosomal protein S1 n=1 Tax=Rhynchospora pubera TaxID=906938 RepID=A0AAV8C2G1_9POAL|nr:30S ribosomal protein S1 [Rhynchospora pubera]
MISSLCSTGTLSSLSLRVTDNPSPSLSIVFVPHLRFSPFAAAAAAPLSVSFHRHSRLAARLGPAEDVSASDDATSKTDEEVPQDPRLADWETARSFKEAGSIFEGTIVGFNNGGLLIRFYSLLGFLPYTLLNQARFCKDSPRPILQRAKDLVGSTVSVKVVEANEERRSLILSEKDANWSRYSSKIEVGSVIDGRVDSIEDYGAFVSLLFPDGEYHLTGLVHISEASWDIVQDARNLFAEGDDVKVKVINIDREKQRISLSIKQLEKDPLYNTLDKVITEEGEVSTGLDANMEPLPGLDSICQELLKEQGITDVQLGRQGLEKRAVSQDLELWLSSAPVKDKQFTLLARAGRQVQEVYLTTTLEQDDIKKAVQRILERVP